jgi:hypothetical protein
MEAYPALSLAGSWADASPPRVKPENKPTNSQSIKVVMIGLPAAITEIRLQ